MLDEIPIEILYQIVLQLKPKDIVSVSLTNTEFNGFIKTCDYLWKCLCEKHNVGRTKDIQLTWREWFQLFHLWQWDQSHASEHLSISPDRLTCSRSGFGSNPSVKANWPLSPGKSIFEVTVITPGNWLSIGLSTPNFSVDSGYYLGSAVYRNVFECTYYSDQFMSDVLYMGTKVKDCTAAQPGDIVTIFVESNAIHFFKNENLLSSVTLTPTQLATFAKDPNQPDVETFSLQLIPTISVGSGGKVEISKNFRKMDLQDIIAGKIPTNLANKRAKII